MRNFVYRDIARPFRALISSGYYAASGRFNLFGKVASLDALLRSGRERIEDFALHRLEELLRHAARTVPYYRDLLAGDTLNAANARDTLATLPIVTKRIIRGQGLRMLSATAGERPFWNTSGGSTGEPIRLLQDRRNSRDNRLSELLFMHWAGHRPGERTVSIWGVPKETLGQRVSWHERMFGLAHNERKLNCYQITETTLKRWTKELSTLRPALVEGYVDALCALSRHILSTKTPVPSPRGVISSAGVLLDDARATISNAFGCQVFNRYGSREVGDIACSCGASKSLHINEGRCLVEIVDDEGQPCSEGVEGDILVTLYSNYSMPLIRYRIEDRGVWASSECSCGLTTKRLAAVLGRSNAFLRGKRGTRVSGIALTTLFYAVRSLREYQVRQSLRGDVTLTVVPTASTQRESLLSSLAEPIERLSALLEGWPVTTKVQDHVPLAPSGKRMYVITDMADE